MIQVGLDEGATLLTGELGRPRNFEKGWFVNPQFSQMFQITCK